MHAVRARDMQYSSCMRARPSASACACVRAWAPAGHARTRARSPCDITLGMACRRLHCRLGRLSDHLASAAAGAAADGTPDVEEEAVSVAISEYGAHFRNCEVRVLVLIVLRCA
jgi:hypothetical protein